VRCFLEEWVIQQLGTGWPLGRVSLNTCLQSQALRMNTATLQEWWTKLLAMVDMHKYSCFLPEQIACMPFSIVKVKL